MASMLSSAIRKSSLQRVHILLVDLLVRSLLINGFVIRAIIIRSDPRNMKVFVAEGGRISLSDGRRVLNSNRR